MKNGSWKWICVCMAMISVGLISSCKQDPEAEIYTPWQYDAEFHWRLNSKGEEVNKSIHNFLEGECTLCGMKDPYAAPDESSYDDSNETQEDPQLPEETQSSGDLDFAPIYAEADGRLIGYSVSADKDRNTRTTIEIPSEFQGMPVLTIQDAGFANMTKLQSILIPNGITSIGYEAFLSDSSLEKIEIPDSVTWIDQRAFAYCTRLKVCKFSENEEFTRLPYEMFYGCESLQEVVIPDQITHIPTRAFERAGIKLFVLGKGIKTIDSLAFNQSKMEGICIYSLEQWCAIEFKSQISSPLYRGHRLYLIDDSGEKTEIKNLVIPESVKVLNRFQFSGCSSIEELDFSSVLEVRDEVFLNCTNLMKVKFPERLSSIGRNFFYQCTSLVEVEIPNGVRELPATCFFQCKSLKKITIPNTVVFIDYLVFNGCLALEEIDFQGTMEEWKAVRTGEGSGWNSYCGNYRVICTDGILSKEDKT